MSLAHPLSTGNASKPTTQPTINFLLLELSYLSPLLLISCLIGTNFEF
jgi:hypothetical protein